MRRAFELAFSTAYVFSSGQPRVRAIDDVQFQRPVEIGNLLRLNASIVATRDHGGSTEDDAESEPLMAVEVSRVRVRSHVVDASALLTPAWRCCRVHSGDTRFPRLRHWWLLFRSKH